MFYIYIYIHINPPHFSQKTRLCETFWGDTSQKKKIFQWIGTIGVTIGRDLCSSGHRLQLFRFVWCYKIPAIRTFYAGVLRFFLSFLLPKFWKQIWSKKQDCFTWWTFIPGYLILLSTLFGGKAPRPGIAMHLDLEKDRPTWNWKNAEMLI